jgi:hypothetical protein
MGIVEELLQEKLNIENRRIARLTQMLEEAQKNADEAMKNIITARENKHEILIHAANNGIILKDEEVL